MTFRKGEHLFMQGQASDYLAYMVVTGEVEIFTEDETQKHCHIAYIGPQQIIGETALLHGDETKQPVHAIATVTPTQCRIMDHETLNHCLHNNSPFVISLLKLLITRYRSLLEDNDAR